MLGYFPICHSSPYAILHPYAPTSEYSDEEIEVFYELIEETISNTPKKEFVVNLGDWNAKEEQMHILHGLTL